MTEVRKAILNVRGTTSRLAGHSPSHGDSTLALSRLRRRFRLAAFLANGFQRRGRLQRVGMIGAQGAPLRFQTGAEQALGFVELAPGTKE